jgi:hypothetical protein
VRLHAAAREAPDAVGGDHGGRVEAQVLASLSCLDAGHLSGRRAEKPRGPHSRVELRAGGDRALQELRVGLLALDHVPAGTVEGGGDTLAQVSGTGIDGEPGELAVVGFVEPVAEAHQ